VDAAMKAHMEQLQQQIATGPADQVIARPGGERLRMRRAPEPGVLAIVDSLETHDPVRCITWEPAASPPREYPSDLPFLAHRVAMFSSTNGNRQLQWYQAVAQDADQIATELREGGWTETTLPMSSMPGMTIRPFRRGDRQRVLISSGSTLSLVDTRAE
jgi:hypothetical protein